MHSNTNGLNGFPSDNGKTNGNGASHFSENPIHTDTNGNLTNTDLPDAIDLVCLSHLRWGFVYQRPQHLLSRWARERRVFFVEEPVFGEGEPRLQIVHDSPSGVRIVVPTLPHGLDAQAIDAAQMMLLDALFREENINEHILWYYTPMAYGFTQHLNPLAVVYDCMDELSAFKGAPQELVDREADLFNRADLVFTGGVTLYEAKREKHPNVHAFPSSVDAEHFMTARDTVQEPEDQASIPHPRIGFFGVIDERMDIDLLRGVAEARPDVHLVMIGPVVKIDSADLPHLPNIHYLGGKDYKELPAYLAGWDIAMMPFARNESTRFISPTKTPEYLAAGRPVISTPIRDVVRPYGELGLVKIAETPEEFSAAIDELLDPGRDRDTWLREVDAFLAGMSWNNTWQGMKNHVGAVVGARTASHTTTLGTESVAANASTVAAHPSMQGE